jgi:hypothetical protein
MWCFTDAPLSGCPTDAIGRCFFTLTGNCDADEFFELASTTCHRLGVPGEPTMCAVCVPNPVDASTAP